MPVSPTVAKALRNALLLAGFTRVIGA